MEAELSDKFERISMRSTDVTAGIRDAAPEVYAFCRRRFPKFDVPEKEVRRELLKHCNQRTERLDYQAFLKVCEVYEEKYGSAGGQNQALNVLRTDFRERFRVGAPLTSILR